MLPMCLQPVGGAVISPNFNKSGTKESGEGTLGVVFWITCAVICIPRSDRTVCSILPKRLSVCTPTSAVCTTLEVHPGLHVTVVAASAMVDAPDAIVPTSIMLRTVRCRGLSRPLRFGEREEELDFGRLRVPPPRGDLEPPLR